MTFNSPNIGVVLPENKYKSCHSRAGGNPEQTWLWLLIFQRLVAQTKISRTVKSAVEKVL